MCWSHVKQLWPVLRMNESSKGARNWREKMRRPWWFSNPGTICNRRLLEWIWSSHMWPSGLSQSYLSYMYKFRVAWSMWHVICWQGQENGQKFYWIFWHQVWMWYEGLLWWWNLRNWYPHPKMNTLYCTEPGQGGRTVDCFRWSIANMLARRVCFVSLHCFNNFAGVIMSYLKSLWCLVVPFLEGCSCCCFIPEDAAVLYLKKHPLRYSRCNDWQLPFSIIN